MPRYTILPTDHVQATAEINALNSSAVLNVVGQLPCKSADILQDGQYAFSLRLGQAGLWTIFQRDDGLASVN